MRSRARIGGLAVLVLVALLSSGCVEAFVDGLSRGFADGVAFVVEEFVKQLPGQSAEG
jgi:hypothetical protein